MSDTVYVSPEAQGRPDAEATQQPPHESTADASDTEEAAFADMRALSLPALQEYWINEEDAAYDAL